MNGFVRGLLEGLAILATLEVAMAALSVAALWRIERLTPAQGGFLRSRERGCTFSIGDRGRRSFSSMGSAASSVISPIRSSAG